MLLVEDGELDLDRFERLVRGGREALAAGSAKDASRTLGDALALWRGPALAEFGASAFARQAGGRLDEARLEALEERIEADLALGRHAEVVPELEELVGRHPLRERPRGQLMLALYRSGRQSEALELYRETRETLVEELGIDPSPELQALERAILQHDPSLQRRRPRQAGPGEEPHGARPRRRSLLALTFVLAAAAAAGATAALVVGLGNSQNPSKADLAAFVGKVENFLVQSRDGRHEVRDAVAAVGRCRLTPRAAALRLDRVQRNRQSLLQQVAALSVPDGPEALRTSDRFQKAVQASIAADWHYRDWLLGRTRCGKPSPNRDLHQAWLADRHATRAKRAFIAEFNPLAQRFGRRQWSEYEF
jgi:DNA-binding SARP family transcriptional activator